MCNSQDIYNSAQYTNAERTWETSKISMGHCGQVYSGFVVLVSRITLWLLCHSHSLGLMNRDRQDPNSTHLGKYFLSDKAYSLDMSM